MELEITQEDIDKGAQSSCGYCPIARAFKRTVSGVDPYSVRVSAYSVEYRKSGETSLWVYKPSFQATVFMRHFDMGGKKAVKPCKLEFAPYGSTLLHNPT